MSKLLRKVIAVVLMVKVIFATLVSYSSDVHEWLHVGEQLCWHAEHTSSNSQHDNHHGRSEQHQHGLLTFLAEGHMYASNHDVPCAEKTDVVTAYFHISVTVLLPKSLYRQTASRAPPAIL